MCIDVQLVFTAPSTCLSKWTFTTRAMIDVPPMVTNLQVISVSTIVSVVEAFGATTTMYDAYLAQSEVPMSQLSSASSLYQPLFSRSCSIPYYYTASGAAPTATSSLNVGSSSSFSYADCDPFSWYFGGINFGGGYICGDTWNYVRSPDFFFFFF